MRDLYRAVADPALAGREGIFVAEGRLVVRRLLADSPYPTRSVMVTEPARAALADLLDGRPDLPLFVVPQAEMNAVAGYNIHRGCLALGERPPARSWSEVVARQGPRDIVVALERVTNADNVGGIFRNAAAFGARAVLLDAVSTDPLYRKAIRTSMGASLVVPFAHTAQWANGLADLRARGYALVALTPAADATPLHAVAEDVRGRPIAVVLGHEGEGLTAESLTACTHRARIPIGSRVDSLNVAAAAAIALYELART